MDSMTNLPSLRQTIADYNLNARKSLGQNFILDLNLTSKIAQTAGDLSNCTVIEIGPGPGGLTRSLLMQGARKVYAIEFDDRAIEALQPLMQAAQGRLEIIHVDALQYDYGLILKSEKVKLVANLPYNIATMLLLKWLDHFDAFHSLTLMFQKEVAERLVAVPNTPAYGRLSVITQWFMQGQIAFDIAPECFVPAPKVTSSVVHLQPRSMPFAAVDKLALTTVLSTAFGQRRKMLRVTMKKLFTNSNAETILRDMYIDPTRRAETLSLAEFAKLAHYWENYHQS